jgi:aspartyl/glutamyl-tRNA(Asn/Gln) amidotransferase C subunit
MSESITPEIFEHLVDLASLELDAAQAEYLRQQLNQQLASIHELEAVPMDENIPISLHGVPFDVPESPTPRADEWIPCQDADAILAQAPQVEDRYIIVPDIPHTTLK